MSTTAHEDEDVHKICQVSVDSEAKENGLGCAAKVYYATSTHVLVGLRYRCTYAFYCGVYVCFTFYADVK